MEEIDESERDALIRQSVNQLRYQRQLSAHPHCRDPDHPGCKECEPEHFAEND